MRYVTPLALLAISYAHLWLGAYLSEAYSAVCFLVAFLSGLGGATLAAGLWLESRF